jgi:LacI family transcriptional regulator, galactose operon repressor
MSTIYDVARRAGVAPITVSRVINNSGYIRNETRQRVIAAVEELGYVPNRLASSLRSRRTNVLALVLADISNPFFTLIARGVEDAASDQGYMVIYCNTDESEDEERKYIDLLLQNRVDGILLVPAGSGSAAVETARRNDTPLVVIDRRAPEAEVDSVRGDSFGGAYELGRLLLGLGHRRITLLNGPAGVSTADERLAGFFRALDEAGIPATQRLSLSGRFTITSGREMALQALALEPHPTALLAANNFIALGALQAVQECGLRVPEDISLVGFDDLPDALVAFPFLTVAVQPAYEMAQKATGLLLERVAGTGSAEPQEIILPTRLIVRQSSGGALGANKE